MLSASIYLFVFLFATDSASALTATFYGLPSSYNLDSDKAVPVTFCFDRLVNMHEQSARKHPKWSIELNYARFGKHAIPSAEFETLNALVRKGIVGDSTTSAMTVDIDPLEEQGNNAFCWGAVIDLSQLGLKNESYRWVLSRKRYVIDRKSLAVRWFRQSFKSQRFTISSFKYPPSSQTGAKSSQRSGNRIVNRIKQIKTSIKRRLNSANGHHSISSTMKRSHANDQPDTLFEAAMFGNVRETIRFLDDGAYVNAQEGSGYSALMYAAFYGHVDVAKVLIEAGADVNMKDQYGCTALLKAVVSNQPTVVKLLIDAGADLNESGELYGETAQRIALSRGYKKIAQILSKAQRL